MSGWSSASCQNGWQRVRRNEEAGLPRISGRWTVPDIALTVFAFFVHWEFGLAFLALKLWHQASGHPGSVFTFAREKWERLVGMTRNLMSGTSMPLSVHFGYQSSGNQAFDAWRQAELKRIDEERHKLRAAEREFTTYRNELLHARDREEFDRFMQSRANSAQA